MSPKRQKRGVITLQLASHRSIRSICILFSVELTTWFLPSALSQLSLIPIFLPLTHLRSHNAISSFSVDSPFHHQSLPRFHFWLKPARFTAFTRLRLPSSFRTASTDQDYLHTYQDCLHGSELFQGLGLPPRTRTAPTDWDSDRNVRAKQFLLSALFLLFFFCCVSPPPVGLTYRTVTVNNTDRRSTVTQSRFADKGERSYIVPVEPNPAHTWFLQAVAISGQPSYEPGGLIKHYNVTPAGRP